MTVETVRTVAVSGAPLDPADVVAVARADARVELTDEALAALARARAVVDDLAASGEPVYGVSTGFGALATRYIDPDAARAAAALAGPLARGRVGPRGRARGGPRDDAAAACARWPPATPASDPATAQAYADMLNAGITPVVHEYGSLGCSGDLAPLAHCALALMGEGDVRDADGRAAPGRRGARQRPGSRRVELQAKEGLALINGTDGMLGMLVAGHRRPATGWCAPPTSPPR